MRPPSLFWIIFATGFICGGAFITLICLLGGQQ